MLALIGGCRVKVGLVGWVKDKRERSKWGQFVASLPTVGVRALFVRNMRFRQITRPLITWNYFDILFGRKTIIARCRYARGKCSFGDGGKKIKEYAFTFQSLLLCY